MIGVFDSGTGGLCALARLRAALPRADFCYLGDNAHLPYGEKTDAEIRDLFRRATRFFLSLGADALFLACGTASTVALPGLCAPVPAFGVAHPAAFAAARESRQGRVGVIATTASVRSGVYAEWIRRRRPGCAVCSVPCPALVPLSETGAPPCGAETRRAAHDALLPLIRFRPDVLLLGCTHFARLAPAIRAELPGVRFVDSGRAGTASFLLRAAPFGMGGGRLSVFCTGDPGDFDRAAHTLRLPGYRGAVRVCLPP